MEGIDEGVSDIFGIYISAIAAAAVGLMMSVNDKVRKRINFCDFLSQFFMLFN